MSMYIEPGVEMTPLHRLWIGSALVNPNTFIETEIRQSVNRHEHIDIRVKASRPQEYLSAIEAPLYVQWGRRLLRDFHGYVQTIEPRHDITSYEGIDPYTITALSASSVLRDEHARAWRSRTIPSVMAEVCNGAGLYFLADEHDYVWDNLVQTGESDWQFVVGLADLIGYHLITRSAMVRLVDPYKTIRSAPVAALFSTNSSILSFRPILEYNTSDYGEYTIDTMDDRGQYVQMTSAAMVTPRTTGRVAIPPTKRKRLTLPVGNTIEARIAIEAEQRRHWPLRAMLRANGATSVQPGVLVFIEGVQAEYGGLWYVLDSYHRLNTNEHTLECTLVKDAVVGAGRTTAPTEGSRKQPNIQLDPATGRWRSQWAA